MRLDKNERIAVCIREALDHLTDGNIEAWCQENGFDYAELDTFLEKGEEHFND